MGTGIRLTLALSLVFLLTGTGCHREEPVSTGSSKLVLSGALVRATDVAYSAFEASLKKIGSEDDLGRFFSKIENYDMRIEEKDDSYSFEFVPKNMPGKSLKGGGAYFVVQRRSYEIVSTKYYK
jgi:hypothetical protein